MFCHVGPLLNDTVLTAVRGILETFPTLEECVTSEKLWCTAAGYFLVKISTINALAF